MQHGTTYCIARLLEGCPSNVRWEGSSCLAKCFRLSGTPALCGITTFPDLNYFLRLRNEGQSLIAHTECMQTQWLFDIKKRSKRQLATRHQGSRSIYVVYLRVSQADDARVAGGRADKVTSAL